MRTLLCFLLTLLATDLLFAQTDLSGFYLRHYTSENGLSQNTVKAIAPDEYGFIWLATESGLLRFDGNNFKQFDKNNTGIITSRMFDIQRSRDNKQLLAITSGGELLTISKGKAEKFTGHAEAPLPGSLRNVTIQSFKWRRWQVQPDSLFFHADLHLGALVDLPRGITWYKNDQLYKQTFIPKLRTSKEIFSFNHAIYRITAGPSGDTLQRITPERIDNVSFKGDFAAAQHGHPSGNYFVENSYTTGQSFVFTSDCIYLATPLPDGNIATKLLLSGFEMDRLLVCCTYYDSTYHRIFVGSLTNGLYILNQNKFHTVVYHGKAEHPGINVVYDQVVLNDSTILTGNGTICSSNPAIPPVYLGFPDDKGATHRADPMFRASNGDIWICGLDRIFRMDSNAHTKENDWSLTQPTTLAEDSDGRIWIGSQRLGLFVLDSRQANATPQRALNSPDYIISLKTEGHDLLWICTARHLLRMNIRTNAVDTIKELNNKMARSLYIPRPGEVWICTYEDGLFLWHEGKLTHFPMVNYPHLKTVHTILEDKQGNFWMSTNHGIYQARRTDLLAYAKDETQDEPYLIYYSKESGFLTNEFNGGSPYVGAKLGNGFFTFSSMEGVVFFNPSKIKPELPDGRFIIDKLEMDDKEITPLKGLVTLNRTFRTFKITPVSAYMGDPANLQYEFRINNDSGWNKTYNGSVFLSSLPVGHNHISIRKKAGFGGANYYTQELMVYVPPAWWQTQWFYISAGILLILLVWLIIRLRVRHWKKRNALLETAIQRRTEDLKDIINDLEHSENRLGEQLQFQTKLNERITHDITTPLKYLSLFTNQIVTRTDDQNALAAANMQYVHQDINRIYEVVQHLSAYMRAQLSENSASTSFSIHSLVRQKAELFKNAATARNSIIENKTDPALIMHHNDSLIGIMLHNLLDNAVKNTENGKIIITATEANGAITLCIADTGKGMTQAQLQACNDYFSDSQTNRSMLNPGFGFQIIKEIAVLNKIEIQVATNEEKGVSFKVVIPQK